MRTEPELLEKLFPYRGVSWHYDPDVGYIAWRAMSGDNLEVLFIEVREKGKGQAVELYRRMVNAIKASGKEPYYSVVGFRLGSNEAANRMYQKLGFRQQLLIDDGQRTVYGGDDTVVMWIPWVELVERLGVK